ncbi:hypothetical protein [Ekhidna sp.]
MQADSLTSIQTRNKSRRELINLNEKQKIVFNTIKMLGPVTIVEIAEYLNWRPGVVSARISELRDHYVLIKQHGNKKNGKSTTVCTWVAFKDPDERMEAIYNKRKELKEKIDDLVNDFHNGSLHGYTISMVEQEKHKLQYQLNKIEKLW